MSKIVPVLVSHTEFQQILVDLAEISDRYVERIARKFELKEKIVEMWRDGEVVPDRPDIVAFAKQLLERATVRRLVMFEATDEQLEILSYALRICEADCGDPLKDVYELGDREPAESYRALSEVSHRVNQAILGERASRGAV